MNLRDKILSLRPKTETVSVWGETLTLRSWSAKERVIFAKFAQDNKDNPSLLFAQMIISSVVDSDNNLLFSSADLEALQDRDWDSLLLLSNKIIDMNGMGDQKENPFPAHT